ncbi:MAG TPA: VOC family protein [Microvirga sp.]|jgi:predicted enzyme related to lactoylglutathione lyase
MTNPAGSFIWYELMTPDPEGSKRFYDSVVAGWTIEAQPSGEMDYQMIARSDGGHSGGLLRLSEEMQEHGARPCWLGYLGVPDVDAAVAQVETDGGRTLLPGRDLPGIGRIAMVADPDGAPIYLMTPTPPVGQPDTKSDVFSVNRPQHVRWNELQASDQERSVSFYTRHFGWRQEGAMDMGDLGSYRFLYQDEVMIGAIMPKMPGTPQAAWTFYIGVADIDRAAQAVRAGGATILQEPIEIPGGEYSLTAIDPQGAVFGLVGPRHQGE